MQKNIVAYFSAKIRFTNLERISAFQPSDNFGQFNSDVQFTVRAEPW